MEIARAVILTTAAPYDEPWPCLTAGSKHLVPVANKPILFHNLEALRAAGVLEALIFTEPGTDAGLRATVGDGSAWGLNVAYAEAAPGLQGTLRRAGDFIADEPVLVEPADMLLRERIAPHLAAFASERLDAMALRLSAVEARAPGGYLLSREAVDLVAAGDDRGTDLLAYLRSAGRTVRVQDVDGCRPCHGGQESLLDANRRLLEGITADHDPASLVGGRIQGPVIVHPSARIERSVVRGPAIIGAGARIADAYVGPYSSIGARVQIEGAEIEHSIVLDDARIAFVGTRLESSVIGRGARVMRTFELPSAIRLAVGDGADITLS